MQRVLKYHLLLQVKRLLICLSEKRQHGMSVTGSSGLFGNGRCFLCNNLWIYFTLGVICCVFYIAQILPDVGKSAQEDISAQLKIMVSSVISKLDLVSREEFDSQQAVLLHTREKLELLEKRFEELEEKLSK